MFCTKALQNSELISIDKRFPTIAYKYVWSSGLDIILPSRWPEFPQAFYSYFVDIQNLSNFQGKYLLSAYKRQQVTFLTKKYPFMKTPGCCQTLALLCRLWKNCIWKLHFYYVTWFKIVWGLKSCTLECFISGQMFRGVYKSIKLSIKVNYLKKWESISCPQTCTVLGGKRFFWGLFR